MPKSKTGAAALENAAGAPRVPARHLRLVGCPMDLGADRRGVDMGPSAIRYAGISSRIRALGHMFSDAGDVPVPIPETRRPGRGPKYLKEIFKACERLSRRVEQSLTKGETPLVIGGDHSIAIGTITGVASYYRKNNEKIGLIWVDAHADMNTPDTSPTGNIHGMPLSAVLGMGAQQLVHLGGFTPKVSPENVALIGIRDLDPAEKEIVKTSGIHAFTMRDVDEMGMAKVMRVALNAVNADTAGFHLSFDLDGLDPEIAPGVGTPVRGGIGFREAHLLMEMVADSGRMLSIEATEINPILDTKNKTAELMVELIASALGKRIL
ncbi:MAG: arginase [Planctomycetes bacterium]|nr:arginase [Planctomycetota bacterium]